MPLSAQTTAPPDCEHWLLLVQDWPSERVPPLLEPDWQIPATQSRLPQHPAPIVHAPPAFRQQLRLPSVEMPLSAQTTAPPDCEHWLVEVQDCPSVRVPPLELDWHVPSMQSREPQHAAPLLQDPPAFRQQLSDPSDAMPLSAQTRSPQQCAPAEQAPPSLRQQFNAPSPEMPLSAQTAGPPLCEHCPVEVQVWPRVRFPPLEEEEQTPLTQRREPQQPAPVVQERPSLWQQLRAPSPAIPLSPQISVPQQWEPAEQVPPPLRQQLSAPSPEMPLSSQMTAPPA